MAIRLNEPDKLIKEIGYELITKYKLTGVLPGVNGPYNDKETIVRNLSHLIVITSIEVILNGNDDLKSVLTAMADRLLEEEHESGVYILRNDEKKDLSNGVIGNAWVIEAFVYLFKATGEKRYIDKAIQIYLNHEFNNNMGLWKRPKIDSKKCTIDYTLNHQLWFAGISSQIMKYSDDRTIPQDMDVFLRKLEKMITIDSQGLICHSLIKREGKKETLMSYIKRKVDLFSRKINRPSYHYKEIGYHLFNVAALARLYIVFPNHDFWSGQKFKKILNMTNSILLLEENQKANNHLDISLNNQIDNISEKEINIYGFPYNVPGFEMFYLKQVFKDRISDEILNLYIEKQFDLTYDEPKKRFGKNCFDESTINYRIYEYYIAMEVRDQHL